MEIKDSGDRRVFDTGAVRDMSNGQKGRCDLMPLGVISQFIESTVYEPKPLREINNFVKSGDNTKYLYNALYSFAVMVYDRKPETMILELAHHFEDGAKKYGENNWQKGLPVSCYIDSAVRHYLKWRRGDKDERHDRAFVWNIVCCIWEVDYHDR